MRLGARSHANCDEGLLRSAQAHKLMLGLRFKRPTGVNTPFSLIFGSLEERELEAILDSAFLR